MAKMDDDDKMEGTSQLQPQFVPHGMKEGRTSVGKDELSSKEEKPLRALGQQAHRQNMPRGMGRSVAKLAINAAKARVKPRI